MQTLSVVQISTQEFGGGAEKIARELHEQAQARGHRSVLAAGAISNSDAEDRISLDPREPRGLWRRTWAALAKAAAKERGRIRGAARLERGFRFLQMQAPTELERRLGREPMGFPQTRRLMEAPAPDLYHAHNLHGDYFDLRLLPELSRRAPFLITMHDAWLLSGHCAHSFACERWKTGCGQCPDLSIYPALPRDGTASNWKRKRRIYERSRLFVATPSRWLLDRVEQSMLAPNIRSGRVIPNGIDLSIFYPRNRSELRRRLGLPEEAFTPVFAANGIRSNPWKDYAMLREALGLLAEQLDRELICIAVGEDSPEERIGRARIRFVPYQRDPQRMAELYSAGDVYLHATRADTFPLVVLEALACGLPAVASRVGGLPEQIREGETGYTTPPGDAAAMAAQALELARSPDKLQAFQNAAARDARERFSLNRMIEDYLVYYDEILASA